MITIVLAMIVKDEGHVIRRALSSCLPYIDHWVICDTGSSDDTIAIIEGTLQGIPGHLYRDPWVDFATNRTLMMQRARRSGCDYTLVLDADEILHVANVANLEALTHDAYVLRGSVEGRTWLAQRLVRTDLDWRYEGVIHEHLACDAVNDVFLLEDPTISTPQDGARSQDPGKIRRDMEVLERALQTDPDNSRYLFHLACGYQILGETEKAINAFERRQMMGGNDTEVWYSGYQLGRMYHQRGLILSARMAYLEAYADFPQAAEPLYWLGRMHLEEEDYAGALPYLELAATKTPSDVLFLREDPVYQYQAKLYLAMCLVRLDRLPDANAILLELGRSGALPEGALDSAHQEILASYAEKVGA